MLWEKNNKSAAKWTKQDEQVIITLWNDGYTGYEIARHLKTTRSAILGKIGRMRKEGVVFERQYTPAKERVAKAKPRRTPHPKPMKVAIIPKIEVDTPKKLEPVVSPESTCKPIPFAKLTNKTCKYSVSGKLPHDYMFCGAPVHKHCLCEYHFGICYTGKVKNAASTRTTNTPINSFRKSLRTPAH